MTKTKQHRCQAHFLCVLAVAIFLGATALPLRAQEKQEQKKAPKQATTKAPTQQIAPQQKQRANKAAAKRQAVNPKRANLRNTRATSKQGARGLAPAKAANRGIPKPTVVLKPGEVPAIKFDTPTYEFGRIRSGTDVLHDFWFTNTGTGPLEILRVKPS